MVETLSDKDVVLTISKLARCHKFGNDSDYNNVH